MSSTSASYILIASPLGDAPVLRNAQTQQIRTGRAGDVVTLVDPGHVESLVRYDASGAQYWVDNRRLYNRRA